MSKLREVVEILDNNRIPLSSKVRADLKNIYPYYGAQGIIDYVDSYIFDGEYILVAEDGNNLKTLSESIVNWATGKFWVNNHAHILGKKKGTDLKFIFYLLKCMDVRRYITGSAQPKLNQENLANIELNLPSLNIQIKTSNFLSVLDSKIELNNKIISELESMAETIYDYWFLQFDFPNENGKPYKSSGGKMVWNEDLKREIPEGWTLTTIGNITDCFDSLRIPLSSEERALKKGNIPYYGATGIMGYVNEALFDGDYVLMAEDGSIMDDNYRPVLQRVSGSFWVNNHTHILSPKNGYGCKLLMMLLKDVYVPKIKTGSVQAKITQENMNNIVFVDIPNELKKKINFILDLIDRKVLFTQVENQELASLRDFLLPMLMNGQVTFKDLK